jgi:hypothetical protein
MTDHAQWQALAAIAMDFELDAGERAELDGHLRDCVECRRSAAGFREDAHRLRSLDFGLAPAPVRTRLVAASGPDVAAGPSAILLFVAGILLILATFGAAIGVGSLVNDRGVELPGSNRVQWQADAFDLQATDFRLAFGGDQFFAAGPVTVTSDARAQVQVAWQEHGREMRLQMHLGSDGRDWWVSEIQALSQVEIGAGDARFEGVSFAIPEMRRPLGAAFVRELAVSGPEDPAGVASSLEFGTLQLTLAPDIAFGPGMDPGIVVGIDRPPMAVPAPGVNEPVDPNLRPVSLSDPGAAAAAIESCHVREFADRVIGMGRLPSASLVENYATFSSSELEPAWLVLFDGVIQVGDQAFANGICLVFDDGRTLMPLDANLRVKPTLALPPLLP